MKVLVLLAFVALSQASPLPAVLSTGGSTQYRSQDNNGNYAFGYDEGHLSGGTFRRESGSHGVVTGSYGLRDADGRQRIVNYVADDLGFRTDINSNEPGVEPKDPANTAINKPAILAAHAPVIHAAAPIHTYAAPISYAAPINYAAHTHHVAAAPLSYAAPYYGGFAYHF